MADLLFKTTGTQEGDIAAGLISGGTYHPNIPIAQISPQTAFKTPTTQPDTTNYNALLAGTQVSLPAPVDPEQAKVDSNQKAITDRMGELGGQEAFAQQKESEFGVDTSKKALNDLQTQLRALNAEAAAETVKLDNQPIIGAIAQGQQAQVEKLRAIKALSISGQIQAAQGNLSLAQDQVDRAVKLKYEPLKQQLELLNRQLEFNYDSLTRSEKRKADALKQENDEKLRRLDIQEASEKDKNATLLNQMQSYPDAGIKLTDSLETANQKIVSKSQKFALEQAKNAILPNSNVTTDNERALLSQFNGEPIVKDYNTILAKKLSVDKILSSGVGGPGDLALVYEFMKGLDPSSVVRETEYASAAKSGNIFAGALAKFNGYLKESGGFLPEQVKQAFQSIVNGKLQVQEQLYQNVVSQYRGIAERQKLDPNNVVLDYSNANSKNSPFDLKQFEGLDNKSFFDSLLKADSATGTSPVSAKGLSEAIAKVESSGRYDAVSPVNRNGERAYGKYQILASNIPVWTKQLLGKSVSVQEFLGNPVIQDIVAELKIAELLKKHGNAANVASVWFSGRPLKGNTSTDITGVSVPSYVKKVLNNLS